MRRLDKPNFALVDIVEACLPSTRPPRDGVIRSGLSDLNNRESEYLQRGAEGGLFRISAPSENSLSEAEKEMPWLYENKFRDKNGPARDFYDRIISSAPNRLCPMCACGHVSTIDHYLPKSAYKGLAVTPINLIPACHDCNDAKLDFYAEKEEDQTLHPYFDSVDDAVWLYATVVRQKGPVVRYSVNPPDTWPDVKKARVQMHFEKFKLERIYAANAMDELSEMRSRLIKLADAAGAGAVQTELGDWARSRGMAAMNSWRVALYRALADSDWFCSGGHRDIGE